MWLYEIKFPNTIYQVDKNYKLIDEAAEHTAQMPFP